ncbi:hypothetical protein GCM10007857_85670 [Bradyrhizobium iriomotense]|uniref:Uncharacterized protein n=1 Tax=Bradyrhizobium iriomotense TaxID=441950 RepID=A0ABQ6BEI4_9BRAD|nr:hypothetical protein GCM10007857_85670 [Bradyrhizobium iriomotense]
MEAPGICYPFSPMDEILEATRAALSRCAAKCMRDAWWSSRDHFKVTPETMFEMVRLD